MELNIPLTVRLIASPATLFSLIYTASIGCISDFRATNFFHIGKTLLAVSFFFSNFAAGFRTESMYYTLTIPIILY